MVCLRFDQGMKVDGIEYIRPIGRDLYNFLIEHLTTLSGPLRRIVEQAERWVGDNLLESNELGGHAISYSSNTRLVGQTVLPPQIGLSQADPPEAKPRRWWQLKG